MKQIMRIKWNGMDADGCGAGAPGEDFQLLYNVIYNGGTTHEWNRMIANLRDIAKEFTTENDDGETPCGLLYDGDRLRADEYIIDRMSELWPDVGIDYMNSPEGFTIEID